MQGGINIKKIKERKEQSGFLIKNDGEDWPSKKANTVLNLKRVPGLSDEQIIAVWKKNEEQRLGKKISNICPKDIRDSDNWFEIKCYIEPDEPQVSNPAAHFFNASFKNCPV